MVTCMYSIPCESLCHSPSASDSKLWRLCRLLAPFFSSVKHSLCLGRETQDGLVSFLVWCKTNVVICFKFSLSPLGVSLWFSSGLVCHGGVRQWVSSKTLCWLFFLPDLSDRAVCVYDSLNGSSSTQCLFPCSSTVHGFHLILVGKRR